jgi:hypothetical protein
LASVSCAADVKTFRVQRARQIGAVGGCGGAQPDPEALADQVVNYRGANAHQGMTAIDRRSGSILRNADIRRRQSGRSFSMCIRARFVAPG